MSKHLLLTVGAIIVFFAALIGASVFFIDFDDFDNDDYYEPGTDVMVHTDTATSTPEENQDEAETNENGITDYVSIKDDVDFVYGYEVDGLVTYMAHDLDTDTSYTIYDAAKTKNLYTLHAPLPDGTWIASTYSISQNKYSQKGNAIYRITLSGKDRLDAKFIAKAHGIVGDVVLGDNNAYLYYTDVDPDTLAKEKSTVYRVMIDGENKTAIGDLEGQIYEGFNLIGELGPDSILISSGGGDAGCMWGTLKEMVAFPDKQLKEITTQGGCVDDAEKRIISGVFLDPFRYLLLRQQPDGEQFVETVSIAFDHAYEEELFTLTRDTSDDEPGYNNMKIRGAHFIDENRVLVSEFDEDKHVLSVVNVETKGVSKLGTLVCGEYCPLYFDPAAENTTGFVYQTESAVGEDGKNVPVYSWFDFATGQSDEVFRIPQGNQRFHFIDM